MGLLQQKQSSEDRSLPSLIRDLRLPAPRRRSDVAKRLTSFGDEAVQPLCNLLKDPDRSVRDTAAKALGDIGDERAIEPLIEALRDSFAWRRPWFQWIAGAGLVVAGILGEFLIWAGFAVVAAVLLLISLLLIKSENVSGIGQLWGAGWELMKKIRSWFKVGDFFHFHRSKNAYCFTIVEALMKIAERTPSPQLQEALPDLSAVAGDFVQQEERTRETARTVKERIEALTEKLKNLPAPAVEVPADPTALPRPAGASFDESALPRALNENEHEREAAR